MKAPIYGTSWGKRWENDGKMINGLIYVDKPWDLGISMGTLLSDKPISCQLLAFLPINASVKSIKALMSVQGLVPWPARRLSCCTWVKVVNTTDNHLRVLKLLWQIQKLLYQTNACRSTFFWTQPIWAIDNSQGTPRSPMSSASWKNPRHWNTNHDGTFKRFWAFLTPKRAGRSKGIPFETMWQQEPRVGWKSTFH